MKGQDVKQKGVYKGKEISRAGGERDEYQKDKSQNKKVEREE